MFGLVTGTSRMRCICVMSRKGVLISIPQIAYKDWRICYNFADDEEEYKKEKEVEKIYPFQESVDKVK